jgi:hypothetical protein
MAKLCIRGMKHKETPNSEGEDRQSQDSARTIPAPECFRDGKSMSRRKHERFRIRAPVAFRWSALDGHRERGTGVTIDISAEGIAVLCLNACPEVGTAISFDAMIAQSGKELSDIQVSGTGRVVRSTPVHDDQTMLFAAHAYYIFCFDH